MNDDTARTGHGAASESWGCGWLAALIGGYLRAEEARRLSRRPEGLKEAVGARRAPRY